MNNFPPEFSAWFIVQGVLFLVLYTSLTLRLALSATRTYHDIGCTGKGFIAEWVLLGCIVRIVYIACVDLASPEAPPSLAYSLRAINDVARNRILFSRRTSHSQS